MAEESTKKIKYSVHLAVAAVKELKEFLSESAQAGAIEIAIRAPLPFECQLFVKPMVVAIPSWAKKLDQYFKVDGAIASAPSAAVLIFRCEERVMACAYGHGHTMLDDDKRENDFGLLTAANSLSDGNVKLVEKANLGSVIRDATQAAGITKLQEFNVDRALSLVRKLSGNSEDNLSTLSGASSLTLTSHKDLNELHELGEVLLALYSSTKYRKSSFAILDKIKPVTNINLISELDHLLLIDLKTNDPSFELGIPEIDTEPVGYVTISGAK